MEQKTPIETLLKRLEADNSLTSEQRGNEATLYRETLAGVKYGDVAMVTLFAVGAVAGANNYYGLTGLFFLAGTGAKCWSHFSKKANEDSVAHLEEKYGDRLRPPANE